ncbi:hypothetical protein Trydic_g10390 [Trypoxylus dichotomus]
MQSGESSSIQGKARPKKKAWQPRRTYFPRRHNLLATSDQIHGMLGTLHPLLIGRGKLDPSRKIRIYKTVLRLIVKYALAAWAAAATTHINKFQTFQNRILRVVLNAPWFVRNITLHEDAGVDFIRRTATRFFDRVVDHWNPLVSECRDYDPRIPWRLVVGHQD